MPMRRCSGESTRKRPPKDQKAWPAEVLFAFLVEHEDAFTGVGQLGGGDEAGQAGADDDDVCGRCGHSGEVL